MDQVPKTIVGERPHRCLLLIDVVNNITVSILLKFTLRKNEIRNEIMIILIIKK